MQCFNIATLHGTVEVSLTRITGFVDKETKIESRWAYFTVLDPGFRFKSRRGKETVMRRIARVSFQLLPKFKPANMGTTKSDSDGHSYKWWELLSEETVLAMTAVVRDNAGRIGPDPETFKSREYDEFDPI